MAYRHDDRGDLVMSKYIKLEDAIKAITDSCKDRCLDCEFYWNDECAINDILSDLPTIEVSEDAISREYVKGICEDMLDEEMLGHMLGYIEQAPKPKEGEWIIHKINGIPHTVECSHCHQHYDYEELRHLGRSKGYIDIPHCPHCGAKMKGADDDSERNA